MNIQAVIQTVICVIAAKIKENAVAKRTEIRSKIDCQIFYSKKKLKHAYFPMISAFNQINCMNRVRLAGVHYQGHDKIISKNI